jgi:hypothetical protein
MFFRVFTRVSSWLGEEPYRQTLYSISKFQSWTFIMYIKEANILESRIDCCSIWCTSSLSDNLVPTEIIQNGSLTS